MAGGAAIGADSAVTVAVAVVVVGQQLSKLLTGFDNKNRRLLNGDWIMPVQEGTHYSKPDFLGKTESVSIQVQAVQAAGLP